MPTLTAACLLASLSWESFALHAETAGSCGSPATLRRTWAHATEALGKLAISEGGVADQPGLLPLPAAMNSVVEALLRDARLESVFGHFPVTFALAEIDDLMVSSPLVWSDQLDVCRRAAEGRVNDDAWLAQFCLAFGPTSLALETCRTNTQWSFTTSDAGVRILEATLERSDDECARLSFRIGQVPTVVHAARLEGRLLLINGHHRARSLRMLGVRFMPCMISTCHHIEDVLALAPHLKAADVARWMSMTRPPMLRDFERRSLVYVSEARRPVHQLTLQMRAETLYPSGALFRLADA